MAASLSRLRILGESPLLSTIQIIVVDDCSTDETPEVLESFAAEVDKAFDPARFEWTFLRHEKNQGKGAAIRTALAEVDSDLTVIHDADLDYHPADMLKMVTLFVN